MICLLLLSSAFLFAEDLLTMTLGAYFLVTRCDFTSTGLRGVFLGVGFSYSGFTVA